MPKKFPRRTTQGTKNSGFKQGTAGPHGKRTAARQDKLRFGRKSK